LLNWQWCYGTNDAPGKALKWWQLAAEKGDAASQSYLAVLYFNGEGVNKDVAKAIALTRKAAAQGIEQAQFHLGLAYSQGTGVPRDDVKAFEWFYKAAIQGKSRAQNEVGRMFLFGQGVPKDDSKAVEWTQKAAAQGEGDAQLRLSMAYLWGKGVAVDNVLAYAWSNLAQAKGVDMALNMRIIAEGKMSPAEIAEAQRLSSGWKVGTVLARESDSAGAGRQPALSGSLAKKNTGTAFIVNAAGHAITNHHVVEGCTEVRAEGHDGVVKVVTSDVINDLAQLQIPGAVSAQATIASEPAKLRQGEDIVVFGFPLNAVLSSGGNLTPGVVSALTGLGNNTNQIQITAPIQPGSSGSPVINRRGEVVGVVSMKLSDSKMAKATGQVGQNVNFAVSGQTLKTFLDTHKVEYRGSGMFSFGGKSTADLADEARKWTLVVECWK
jgi:S1-C subfamily serine protease